MHSVTAQPDTFSLVQGIVSLASGKSRVVFPRALVLLTARLQVRAAVMLRV